MKPVEALVLVSGHVEKEVLLRNEYLAAENQILKSKFAGKKIKLSDDEKMRLARLGKKLDSKTLKDIGCIVTPRTLMDWYKKFIAKKLFVTIQPGSSHKEKKIT